jgi:protease I
MRQLLLTSLFLLGSLLTTLTATETRPKILFLLAKGFNTQEFYQSYMPLLGLGYDIDVASFEAGTVWRNNSGTPDTRERDWEANLGFDDVQTEDYIGLVVPGGYSPAYLEKDPRAVAIASYFMNNDIPVSGVCHGPRLLISSGLMQDRIATTLFNVPDELADQWQAGEHGTFVDQPVVVDGNLVTGRYPGDMGAFTQTTAKHFQHAGGLPFVNEKAQLRIVSADLSKHGNWALKSVTDTLGIPGRTLSQVKDFAKLSEIEADQTSELPELFVVVPGEKTSALLNDSTVQATLAGKTIVTLDQQAHYSLYAQPLVAAIKAHGVIPPAQAALVPTAVLAVAPGFDDQVAPVILALFEAAGHNVAVASHAAGWVRGNQGSLLEASHSYEELRDLSAENLIVVAPGGIWPQENSKARQAVQPAWIVDQGKRDAARRQWLIDQWQAGATLYAIGFDSLRLGRHPEFKGKRFATSEQARWGFGKGNGRFSAELLEQTDDRLITLRGFEALPLLMREWLQATPAAD